MRVSKRCRFSIRSLLLVVFVVAISLALTVQHWRHHEALVRRDVEIASLRDRLSETQQMLEEIPVSNPQRAYVLAMPSFAYARWVWRVYLPSNSHYALRVNVGHVVENGRIRRVARNDRSR